MNNETILYIEDDKNQQDSFCRTIKDIQEEYKNIHGISVSKRDEALSLIKDTNLIGIIVDLNLGSDGPTSGVKLIEILANNFNKIPIAIYSGTIGDLDGAENHLLDNLYIKKYIKGDATYEEIIVRFIKIANTGINKILGDRGIIEKKLFEIFQKEFIPNIESWIECQSYKNLEEPFTRHAINYLHHIIDANHKDYLSIEFYLSPTIINKSEDIIQTGGIYEYTDGQHYFVITPACDLANDKTDLIQLLPIASKESIINTMPGFKGGSEYTQNMKVLSSNQKASLKRCLSNNATDFLHYFPYVSSIFNGGFINFRNIVTIKSEEIIQYKKILHVSPQFVKDIIARFSSYYARQGQPELSDKKDFLN